MASAQTWLELLALTKALFEATTRGIDLARAFAKYLADDATLAEAHRVSSAYSTFSEDEVQALLKRLKGCRDRFVSQGGGGDRARCICSVLAEAKEGNGGSLPDIDDWMNIFRQLRCEV